MLRKIFAGVGSIIFLLGLNVAGAAELEMRPFLWTQDFEEAEETAPVRFWTGGKYVINFKGLTEEKSFSGRKSFKLDVTFKEGSRLSWLIPIKVPAEGRLNFSARIFLGEETTGRWGRLALNAVFPPTTHSGTIVLEAGKIGEWRLIEEDLVISGKNAAKRVIPRHAWGVKAENVGVYIDRIGLQFMGIPGQRVVLYVDDIKIEGEVPTEESYQKEIKRRWAPAKERFEETISSWEKILRNAEDELASLADLPEEAEKMKREAREKISSTKERVETIKRREFINLREQREIEPFLNQLESIIANIKLLSEGRIKTKDMLLRVVSPISSLKILPFDTIIPGKISDEIRMIATPGEYEPASFVISALADIEALKVEVTDLYLRREEDIIPSENIEIKIVKPWFQAASAWVGHGPVGERRVLVPELLLNNASLVKVDHERQENYLRLSFPEGERYVWISNPEKWLGYPRSLKLEGLGLEEFPVKDSPYLLPVNIPARTNKQFWITVQVPDTARAGLYTGSITLSTEKETLATLTLKLRVLPFKLSSPKTYHNLERDFVGSIFYLGRLHADFPEGTITSHLRSEKQIRAELKNMFAHGITNPTVFQWGPLEKHLERLGRQLKIREEVGMGGKPLFLLGSINANSAPSYIKRVIELAKSLGVSEVYFLGIDEARGERLTGQREDWIAIREAGGKIFVAGYKGSNFPLMGDIQDLQISAFATCREEAALWHSVGHRIFSYANPQTGPENPELFRRNFGLALWFAHYDGMMTYAYQKSFGNIWNDFDHLTFRDHSLIYPTVDGVITTIALVGKREGIDDIRYATTLRLAIEEAKRSKDRKVREKAAEARRYLAELDTDRSLDTIRLEIISYILQLKKGK